MKTIDDVIEILEKITPEDITEENAFIDGNGKGCLAGHIWIKEGFTLKDYHTLDFNSDYWADKVFGTKLGYDIRCGLEEIHMRYAKKEVYGLGRPIKFQTMKRRALKFLRGLKEHE